jgi:tRNA (cmo5U34)-methyltransferase
MTIDRIYRNRRKNVPPFTFNAAVAHVFDDMIRRSVPMYGEVIRRQAQMARQQYRPGTRIYDLGCSNGNLALALCEDMPVGGFDMVAVDNSRPMLSEFEKQLTAIGRFEDVSLICGDIREIEMTRASVVVINYTLQFIPPPDRDALLQRIHEALIPGGVLMFSEKSVHPDPHLSAFEVDFYYRFKKENGYSELEISQKREALENVLVPETVDAHQNRLRRCGFSKFDLWLKWFNFCSWICIK